jgi:hypothetical protein
MFTRMPGWKNEWTAAAAPTGGVDFNTVSSVDYLQNVANDPGQPQATRDAAATRLRALGDGTAQSQDTAAIGTQIKAIEGWGVKGSAEERGAATQTWELMKKNNWSSAQVGAALGMSAAQVETMLSYYGLGGGMVNTDVNLGAGD